MSVTYCTIFLTSQKHHAVTLPNLFPSFHLYTRNTILSYWSCGTASSWTATSWH